MSRLMVGLGVIVGSGVRVTVGVGVIVGVEVGVRVAVWVGRVPVMVGVGDSTGTVRVGVGRVGSGVAV